MSLYKKLQEAKSEEDIKALGLKRYSKNRIIIGNSVTTAQPINSSVK